MGRRLILRFWGSVLIFGVFGACVSSVFAATDQGRIWSSGFELNSLTADYEIQTTGGTGTKDIVTSPVRSGSYALQTTSTNSAAWVRYRFAESNSTGPFYFRQYIRIADLPDSDADIIVLESTGGGNRVGIRLTTSGTLRLMDLDGTPAQVGSDSAALSLDTWYRVELSYSATESLIVTTEARLDGTAFASSESVVNGGSIGRISWGPIAAAGTYTIYWDDLAINTTTFPGDGRIVHLKPNGVGDNSEWTIGAGSGSNYEQVDEVTPDTTTTYVQEASSSGTVIDDYNVEGATSALGSGATINVVQVGFVGGGDGTTARTIVARVKASSEGTVEESSSLDMSFNGWRANDEGPNQHNYDLTLYDLPGGSTTDWTVSDLDSAQIGIRHDAASTNLVRVTTMWLLVDYVSTESDATAPAAVSDLAVTSAGNTSVALSWTAPGDDGSSGTATSYDVRYATSEITAGNFDSATQATSEPTPSVAGSSESFTVTGLSQGTTYFFAMKTSDEVPNTSSISNVVSLATSESEEEEPSPNVIIPPVSVGGVAPTSAVFSGVAYPNVQVEILRKSTVNEAYANVPVRTAEIGAKGNFRIQLQALLQGEYFFAVRFKDPDGVRTGILPFSVNFISENTLSASDILAPPTLAFDRDVVPRGESVTIRGYATPGNAVRLFLDGQSADITTADTIGKYSFATSTQGWGATRRVVATKQIDMAGQESGLSLSRTIRISRLANPRVDMNGDDKVDITDWSIFLFRWGVSDAVLRTTIDMDGNQKIDIQDFSIFLRSIGN